MKFRVIENRKDFDSDSAGDLFDVKIGSKYKNNIYKTFEECARIYFWGNSGWDKAWPLYFKLYTDNNVLISIADIYLLNGASPLMFDVLIKSGVSYMEGHRV
jgi:hypothetical protein